MLDGKCVKYNILQHGFSNLDIPDNNNILTSSKYRKRILRSETFTPFPLKYYLLLPLADVNHDLHIIVI
jgi:hypothetical protein